MKIIDLLNKIANGEEVPKKIKYENAIYDYDEDLRDYVQLDYLRFSLFTHDKEYSITDTLNNEVKIIEEPKKIGKLDIQYKFECINTYGSDYVEDTLEVHTDCIDTIESKLNEIIDYINKDNK